VHEQRRQTLGCGLKEKRFRRSIASGPSRNPKFGLGWAGAKVIACTSDGPTEDIDCVAIALGGVARVVPPVSGGGDPGRERDPLVTHSGLTDLLLAAEAVTVALVRRANALDCSLQLLPQAQEDRRQCAGLRGA
jgi:hypothetical protein